MKKKIYSLLATLFVATAMSADPTIGVIIPLNPIKAQPANGTNPRSPILVPVLYIEGYTLTSDDGTLGSTIQPLDESGNIVFSTYVYVQGDIELPEELEGTYTIRVIRDSQTFEGEFTL